MRRTSAITLAALLSVIIALVIINRALGTNSADDPNESGHRGVEQPAGHEVSPIVPNGQQPTSNDAPAVENRIPVALEGKLRWREGMRSTDFRIQCVDLTTGRGRSLYLAADGSFRLFRFASSPITVDLQVFATDLPEPVARVLRVEIPGAGIASDPRLNPIDVEVVRIAEVRFADLDAHPLDVRGHLQLLDDNGRPIAHAVTDHDGRLTVFAAFENQMAEVWAAGYLAQTIQLQGSNEVRLEDGCLVRLRAELADGTTFDSGTPRVGMAPLNGEVVAESVELSRLQDPKRSSAALRTNLRNLRGPDSRPRPIVQIPSACAMERPHGVRGIADYRITRPGRFRISWSMGRSGERVVGEVDIIDMSKDRVIPVEIPVAEYRDATRSPQPR